MVCTWFSQALFLHSFIYLPPSPSLRAAKTVCQSLWPLLLLSKAPPQLYTVLRKYTWKKETEIERGRSADENKVSKFPVSYKTSRWWTNILLFFKKGMFSLIWNSWKTTRHPPLAVLKCYLLVALNALQKRKKLSALMHLAKELIFSCFLIQSLSQLDQFICSCRFKNTLSPVIIACWENALALKLYKNIYWLNHKKCTCNLESGSTWHNMYT